MIINHTPKCAQYQDRKPAEGQQPAYYDSICPRLYMRVGWGGTKTWTVQFYTNGKVRSKKLGEFPQMGVAAARQACRDFEMNPEGSLARAEIGTFGEIAEQFLERHVRKNGLRSASDIERHIAYVLKRWRDRPFLDIKRRDVADLLDRLEDERGAGVATAVLRELPTTRSRPQTRRRWWSGGS